jgi:hypothetical protein
LFLHSLSHVYVLVKGQTLQEIECFSAAYNIFGGLFWAAENIGSVSAVGSRKSLGRRKLSYFCRFSPETTKLLGPPEVNEFSHKKNTRAGPLTRTRVYSHAPAPTRHHRCPRPAPTSSTPNATTSSEHLASARPPPCPKAIGLL